MSSLFPRLLLGMFLWVNVVAQGEDKGPYIRFEMKLRDKTPEGDQVITAPRVMVGPGVEATVQVTDGAGVGIEFGAMPTITDDGKISFLGDFSVATHKGGKLFRGGQAKKGAPSKPGQVAPLSNQPQAKTAVEKPEVPANLDFPKNYRMHGFAKLPGRVPRINLENTSTGSKFWIELGEVVGGIRFASVDYAHERPVAILAQGDEFARVSLDDPVLQPYEPPVELKVVEFRYEDILEPGKSYFFNAGTNHLGQPRELEIVAEIVKQ